ncbi:hypothetical protein Kfla_4107 [Kribbella flavida DSM 17836]|uniref:Uncharacterized protein n=1 Tax=Kribbella flavida (strain DSM 17836 / JCM 10339 / NBRC 14399) TaxID=479435 RepID=D2PSL6_KRIFD|nr:hypothetical protein Kfla_4107 [Kribbella flavida DSM 17836]
MRCGTGPDRAVDAGRSGPRSTVGRSPPNPGGHRVKVPHLLSLAGPARRARLVPDRPQTADQMDRGRHLGNASLPRSRQRPRVLTTSAGPCWWTPPSAGPTSTPPEPGKEGSGPTEPDDHALARSRGGLSTKVHLASDSRARPWPSASPQARQATPRPSRPSWPPSDQAGHRLRRGSAGGRPPAFDAEAYKERNAVERCINRLKQWRGLALRTDKLAIAYQAALHLAAILIWAR